MVESMGRYLKQADQLNRCKTIQLFSSQTIPKLAHARLSQAGRVFYRLSPQTVAAVVADYAAGQSGDQVAAKYGISRFTVLKLVRAAGVAVRYERLTERDKRAILELRTSGTPIIHIAEHIERSPSAVWHYLNRTATENSTVRR